MNTEQKLNILADSSKFDLACACKYKHEPGRMRGDFGRWIYPAALPSGRKVFLLKTLQSNACVNDCRYCPFNQNRNHPRCTLKPDELAHIFMQLHNSKRVNGLFLSSGACGSADATMAQMSATVEILRRRHKFKGFVHLKVIPGASEAAIEQALRLATRVSVNIEAPSAERLRQLTSKKRFHEDIISAMRTIYRLRQEKNTRCQQTTQFVVGAAGETDREIVTATERLYRKFRLERVYFSTYQDPDRALEVFPLLFSDLPVEKKTEASEIFMREHRLYQVDFLLRKYGFDRDDISFNEEGNLSLHQDPKTIWARNHPEFFPVKVNHADRRQLLRVPGIGPIGVRRILSARRQRKISSRQDLKYLGVRTSAGAYLAY